MEKDKQKKESLAECQKQRDEYLAGWQRARADFLNYKKEEVEKITEILKYANEGLVLKVLSVLDNFERAEKELSDEQKRDEAIKGFLQIKKQLQDFLKNQGVEEIKGLGEKFDPNFHEVIEEVEGKDSGTVFEEIQKGYKLQGRVIRPAKVKVVK